MALRRRSALQAAEKLVARGRLDAAVKQYKKALEDSPDDTGTLNRLGDLYARLNRVNEAVEMFSTAARHFTREGFFVKAIAIYKKIIRLDPTLIRVYETLADLYHRQGLVNEARAQYQVVADYYRQSADERALVAVYEKLVDLEPSNPTHRLKLAEFYCTANRTQDAMEQYQSIATFMLQHGKVEEAFKVYLGAFELKVDDLGFVTDVIVQLTDFGHQDVARRLLDHAIQRNPDATRVAELVDLPLVDTVERRGTEDSAEDESPVEVSAAAEEDRLAIADPDSGADLAGLEEAGADAGSRELEVVELADLDLLEPAPTGVDAPSPTDAPYVATDRDETGEFEIDLDEIEDLEEVVAAVVEAESPGDSTEAMLAPETEDSAELAEVTDPESVARAEELLTEANVLSNYGLEKKAVELLETALELVPGHLDAGELLLHLHHEAGRSEAVVEVAQLFITAGSLSEPLTELLGDWGYRLQDGELRAPAVEAQEPERLPVEVAQAPAADIRLDWLDEGGEASPKDDADVFGEEDEFFDLAAELEEELLAEESRSGGEALPQLEEQSIEEIVEGFKQGVAETLSSEDYDTHFNLGIAYREMGLVDEAIGEFQLAAKSNQYLVDCCSLLGASFLEKGFPDLAVKWYERGLKAPGASDEEKLGLLYELGNLNLTTGNRETAKETFAEIYGANSNYRDVVAKLEELR